MGTQMLGERNLEIVGSDTSKKIADSKGKKSLVLLRFLMVARTRRIDCVRITGNIFQNPFDKISVFQINLK